MDNTVKINYGQDTVWSILLKGFKSIREQRSAPTSRSDWNWSLALLNDVGKIFWWRVRVVRDAASVGARISLPYTTSRMVFSTTVLIISQPSFCPRVSAFANCQACSVVILPGSGGSLGSTTA